MDERQKAQSVGDIPSGLYIVCSQNNDGHKDGYLASWVQQASFKPLLISLSINESRPGYKHIVEGGTFTINIVGDQNSGYLKHFWKGYAPGEGPFNEIPHDVSPQGGIIIKDAKSVLECKMVSKTKPGDHTIIFAEVLSSSPTNESFKSKVHLRKNGLDY
tara:strand:- start:5042 stop:5521 length:480 start_codon:yes stop_codon:yes gene_type:complete